MAPGLRIRLFGMGGGGGREGGCLLPAAGAAGGGELALGECSLRGIQSQGNGHGIECPHFRRCTTTVVPLRPAPDFNNSSDEEFG